MNVPPHEAVITLLLLPGGVSAVTLLQLVPLRAVFQDGDFTSHGSVGSLELLPLPSSFELISEGAKT